MRRLKVYTYDVRLHGYTLLTTNNRESNEFPRDIILFGLRTFRTPNKIAFKACEHNTL